MQNGILSPAQQAILTMERQWLTNLQIALAQFPAVAEDREALEKSIRQLDELFLLVVVGEFNAGKSAFINALFGQALLEQGVTPTTTRVQMFKYGERFERVATHAEVDIYGAPVPMLQQINLVDTPGTNAIRREHEALTQEFIPRSDLVLFVTSVERPFTESERAFLERIREWGKRVVIVINKIDTLEDPDDLARVQKFVQDNVQTLLGFSPDVFPISARWALKAKLTHDDALLAQSRIDVLERYIADKLDEKERIALKLRNPLGVGQHLIDKHIRILDQRLTLLGEDLTVMDSVTRQTATYQQDVQTEFRFRLSDVDRELQAFENRGIAYFDETIRLVHFFNLLDKAKLEADFKEQVVADVPKQIETRAHEITEWMIASNQKQWQDVVRHIERRKEKHAEQIVGEVGGPFENDRSEQIDRIMRATQQVLLGYNKNEEARRIAESLQRAVANTAIAEVGAVGLGAAVTIIATTTALDVTGIVAASAVAVLGLLVIPNRKRQMKQELRERIEDVRVHLMESLTRQFDYELSHSMEGLNAAISPYTRYIRTQQSQVEESRKAFITIRQWLERQAAEIDALVS